MRLVRHQVRYFVPWRLVRWSVAAGLAGFLAVTLAAAQPAAVDQLLEEVASFSSSRGRVKALLDGGVDANSRSESGETPLMVAAAAGNQTAVAELLGGGARTEDTTADGVTALMAAAREGRADAVRLLTVGKARLEVRDGDGWTALMYAAFNGEWSAVEALLEAKADPNAETEEGWRPLLLAVDNGSSGTFERLRKAGGRIGAKNPDGLPALERAVYGGDSEVLIGVLDLVPGVDPRGPKGETPLIVAAAIGETELVMELLRRGADVALEDQDGDTALALAQANEHEEVVAVLGGPFAPRRPAAGGTTLAVDCPALGGKVEGHLARAGDQLAVSVFYPRPLGWYLGGFERGAKKVSPNAAFHFDLDGQKSTGMTTSALVSEAQVGTEITVDFSEIRTSVRDDANDRMVSRQVMDATIEKLGEPLGLDELGDYYPASERELNQLSLEVPVAVLGLPPGQAARVAFEVGFCRPVEAVLAVE